MKKLNLILAFGILSSLTFSNITAFASEKSNWPDFENYSSVFPNPGQPGLEYVFTQVKKIPAGYDALALTPLKVTSGEGVDTHGGLLKYRIYTQCFLAVGYKTNDYHGEITIKPGHRFYTKDKQSYLRSGGDDMVKIVTNNTPPYTHELKSKYSSDLASLFDKPLVGVKRLQNECNTNATASRLNPGYCRMTFVHWEAGFDVLHDREVVRLICERSALFIYESNKANFNVSPDLVKKSYSITNQEANALLSGAGIKLTKAR